MHRVADAKLYTRKNQHFWILGWSPLNMDQSKNSKNCRIFFRWIKGTPHIYRERVLQSALNTLKNTKTTKTTPPSCPTLPKHLPEIINDRPEHRKSRSGRSDIILKTKEELQRNDCVGAKLCFWRRNGQQISPKHSAMFSERIGRERGEEQQW